MGKAEEGFHGIVEALVMGQSLPEATKNEAIRFNRQRAIEDSITSFNNDYTEAFEFVHAIWNALETRHGDLAPDVQDALDDLCKALEEAA